MDEHGEPQVTNPCGVCRELLRNYGPEATVLVDAGGEVGSVSLEELLPYPWMRATETEWTTRPPDAGSLTKCDGKGRDMESRPFLPS